MQQRVQPRCCRAVVLVLSIDRLRRGSSISSRIDVSLLDVPMGIVPRCAGALVSYVMGATRDSPLPNPALVDESSRAAPWLQRAAG